MHPVGLTVYRCSAAKGALQTGWLVNAETFGATHASVHRTYGCDARKVSGMSTLFYAHPSTPTPRSCQCRCADSLTIMLLTNKHSIRHYIVYKDNTGYRLRSAPYKAA